MIDKTLVLTLPEVIVLIQALEEYEYNNVLEEQIVCDLLNRLDGDEDEV